METETIRLPFKQRALRENDQVPVLRHHLRQHSVPRWRMELHQICLQKKHFKFHGRYTVSKEKNAKDMSCLVCAVE